MSPLARQGIAQMLPLIKTLADQRSVDSPAKQAMLEWLLDQLRKDDKRRGPRGLRYPRG